MQKKIILLLISVFFLSCGTGVKSRWGNFTAYYNTYYNAKKSYQTGLDKVLDANIVYNPQQPIRIHEVPINAGAQDFDKAIEKGAEILRKHEDSKWVDNSLNLIGKSYYFKKEFFSADQKFQELALTTEDESLIQESILWRSRVLLEMELYGQGIPYILQELNDREDVWNSNKKAELKSILAQYYVAQENWEDATVQLNDALPDLNQKKYKERGYFLLGQLYERRGNYREAFKAYSKVEDYYHDYDLQYLALRKSAETARFLGDNQSALDTFSKMVRDDKNTEFKTELDYEIARTYQEQEKYGQSEAVYKNILKNTIDPPSTETKALVYNGLAEIYRFGYNDFEMAAAYYDTSSRQNASLQKLPESYDAPELAVSFGEYARLKNERNFRDSLLWVSNLPQPKLDSLLAEIKKRKLKEIEEARKNQEQRQNTLVNVSSSEEAVSNEGNIGFLNVNSPTQQENARTQFIAIWGDRPLVDNWRVRELIRSSGPSQGEDGSEQEVTQQRRTVTSIETSIDLSEVPFEPEEKEEARQVIAKLKYELGNLFFISLQMPDSAAIYFKEVIQDHPSSNEVAVSYYSLSEIQSSLGMEDEAFESAKALIARFPNSRYALRLAEKYSVEIESESEEEILTLKEQFQALKQDTSLTKAEFADQSTQLSIENPSNVDSPPILFEATQTYIKLAKEDSIYSKYYDDWNSKKKEWKRTQNRFKETQDSAKVAINDTTLTDAKRIEFQALIDSSLTAPEFKSLFPYYGEYWEKARINLNLFLTSFRNSTLIPRVRALKTELEKPKEDEPETEIAQNPEAEEEPLIGSELKCDELETKPEIRGGLDAFIAASGPFDTEVKELVYKLSINQRGVVENYELLSEVNDEFLTGAFNEAVEYNLTFNPVLVNGEAVQIECEFTFPIK